MTSTAVVEGDGSTLRDLASGTPACGRDTKQKSRERRAIVATTVEGPLQLVSFANVRVAAFANEHNAILSAVKSSALIARDDFPRFVGDAILAALMGLPMAASTPVHVKPFYNATLDIMRLTENFVAPRLDFGLFSWNMPQDSAPTYFVHSRGGAGDDAGDAFAATGAIMDDGSASATSGAAPAAAAAASSTSAAGTLSAAASPSRTHEPPVAAVAVRPLTGAVAPATSTLLPPATMAHIAAAASGSAAAATTAAAAPAAPAVAPAATPASAGTGAAASTPAQAAAAIAAKSAVVAAAPDSASVTITTYARTGVAREASKKKVIADAGSAVYPADPVIRDSSADRTTFLNSIRASTKPEAGTVPIYQVSASLAEKLSASGTTYDFAVVLALHAPPGVLKTALMKSLCFTCESIAPALRTELAKELTQGLFLHSGDKFTIGSGTAPAVASTTRISVPVSAVPCPRTVEDASQMAMRAAVALMGNAEAFNAGVSSAITGALGGGYTTMSTNCVMRAAANKHRESESGTVASVKSGGDLYLIHVNKQGTAALATNYADGVVNAMAATCRSQGALVVSSGDLRCLLREISSTLDTTIAKVAMIVVGAAALRTVLVVTPGEGRAAVLEAVNICLIGMAGSRLAESALYVYEALRVPAAWVRGMRTTVQEADNKLAITSMSLFASLSVPGSKCSESHIKEVIFTMHSGGMTLNVPAITAVEGIKVCDLRSTAFQDEVSTGITRAVVKAVRVMHGALTYDGMKVFLEKCNCKSGLTALAKIRSKAEKDAKEKGEEKPDVGKALLDANKVSNTMNEFDEAVRDVFRTGAAKSMKGAYAILRAVGGEPDITTRTKIAAWAPDGTAAETTIAEVKAFFESASRPAPAPPAAPAASAGPAAADAGDHGLY